MFRCGGEVWSKLYSTKTLRCSLEFDLRNDIEEDPSWFAVLCSMLEADLLGLNVRSNSTDNLFEGMFYTD